MKVSVIVPVFNSSEMLAELCQRISKTLINLKLEKKFEIIMINDGSTDNSWTAIKDLKINLILLENKFEWKFWSTQRYYCRFKYK